MKRYGRTLILALFFSCIISLPVFFDRTPFRENDLDGNITSLLYIKNSLLTYKSFPQWNPYINQGIPITADPLNSYLYPPSILSFLLFPEEIAIKVIFFSSIFLSIITMYFLLRYLQVSELISFLISLTFASSGYLASRIAAGHLEKVLSYPLLPLFFFLLLKSLSTGKFIWVGLTSFCLTLLLFTGDLYNTLYSLIILVSAFIFLLLNKEKRGMYIFPIILFFLLFSAVKLIPFIELQGFIAKTREPFEGSQNIASILYYLFIPLKPVFSFLGVQEALQVGFAWWEKIAFIGPVPLLSLLIFLTIKKTGYKSLLLFILSILTLLSMPDLIINPYRYIILAIPQLQLFHVPSRIFGLMIVLLLIIMGIVVKRFELTKKELIRRAILAIVIINTALTLVFFQFVLSEKKLNPILPDHAILLNELAKEDPSHYYIGQYLSVSRIPQYVTVTNNQKLLVGNYGLQLLQSPAVQYTQYDFKSTKEYTDIIPKYFLTLTNTPLPTEFSIRDSKTYNNVTLYRISNFTPYASIRNDAEIKNLSPSTIIRPNHIIIPQVSAEPGSVVQIVESNYPGWSVFVDGTPQELLSDRFISTTVYGGEHSYVFTFQSESFRIGLIISVFSFLLWITVISQGHKRVEKRLRSILSKYHK